jgi:hypothetical protein
MLPDAVPVHKDRELSVERRSSLKPRSPDPNDRCLLHSLCRRELSRRMSFLQQIQKVSDAHYVLPKVGGMRVDVHAFLSDALFAQTDEALWR